MNSLHVEYLLHLLFKNKCVLLPTEEHVLSRHFLREMCHRESSRYSYIHDVSHTLLIENTQYKTNSEAEQRKQDVSKVKQRQNLKTRIETQTQSYNTRSSVTRSQLAY